MKKEYYFYDLHCHTKELSGCAASSLKSVIRVAKKRGLDGIAITDHNKVYQGPCQIDGIDIIPGTEVTVEGKCHLLGYFVKEGIKKGKSFQETIGDIHRQGGFAVWAHPMRKRSFFEENKKRIIPLLDGIEVGNAMEDDQKKEELLKEAEKIGILKTAGTDAHIAGTVGMGVVRTKEKITRENFQKVIQEGDILIREEIKYLRESKERWRGLMERVEKTFRADSNRFLKNVFLKVFLRNHLRISNVKLQKFDFHYKKEGVDKVNL